MQSEKTENYLLNSVTSELSLINIADIPNDTIHASPEETSEASNDIEKSETEIVDGILDFIEEDTLIYIISYLDEDSIAPCFFVNKHWYMFLNQSEYLFREICIRIFPMQTEKSIKVENVLNIWKTWKNMYLYRPHIRHTGLYYLKISYIKEIERSMWTDLPPNSVLEVVYFRYLFFQRNQTVLYCMTTKSPSDIKNLFLASGKRDYVVGNYNVKKNKVYVTVPTKHAIIHFTFRITNNNRGMNILLILEKHSSQSRFDRQDTPWTYRTSEEEFKFLKF